MRGALADPAGGAAVHGWSASGSGGTETHTHADTLVAYLAGYVAQVTVVTDPGLAAAPLGADFPSDLLAETVAAIRG